MRAELSHAGIHGLPQEHRRSNHIVPSELSRMEVTASDARPFTAPVGPIPASSGEEALPAFSLSSLSPVPTQTLESRSPVMASARVRLSALEAPAIRGSVVRESLKLVIEKVHQFVKCEILLPLSVTFCLLAMVALISSISKLTIAGVRFLWKLKQKQGRCLPLTSLNAYRTFAL